MTILTHTCILCILAFWLHSHTSHIFTITISLGNSRNHFICHLFHYTLLHSAQDKWIIYFHCSSYWLWHPSPRTFPWVIGVFDICPYYFYKVSWLLPNKNFIPVHLYFTPLQQVTVICPHARVTSNVWPAGGRNTKFLWVANPVSHKNVQQQPQQPIRLCNLTESNSNHIIMYCNK